MRGRASLSQAQSAINEAETLYPNGEGLPTLFRRKLLFAMKDMALGEQPKLARRIATYLELDDLDYAIFSTMEDKGIYASLAWEDLTKMGDDSNVERLRDWETYPHTGFFGDYLEYTLNVPASLDFHFWSGVAVMSAAMGRRYRFQRGGYALYPNIPTVLIGPSGCGKSSASGIAASLIRRIGDICLMETRITDEGIFKELSKRGVHILSKTQPGDLPRDEDDIVTEGFIYAEELPTLLSKKKYNEGLTTQLTFLFDGRPSAEKTTISEGQIALANVCLGMLGGVTPSGFRNTIPASAAEQGFTSRVMWIRRTTNPRFIPDPPDSSRYLEERCLRHLRRLRRTSEVQRIAWERTDAYPRFVEWLRQNHDSMEGNADPRIAGWLARKPTFVIRLAMILHLAQEELYPAISRASLDLAIDIIDAEEGAILAVLESIEGDSELIDHLERLRYAIWSKARHNRKTPITKTEIARALYRHMNRREMADLLQTAVDGGELIRLPTEPHGPGRPAERYIIGPHFPRTSITKAAKEGKLIKLEPRKRAKQAKRLKDQEESTKDAD